MSKISIEGTTVTLDSLENFRDEIAVSGHLLLIYTNDAGQEYVVRGGPTGHWDILQLEQGVLIKYSDDDRSNATPASRGNTEIPLGGRNADDVWNLILQQAKNINDHQFGYFPIGFNSNGTVGNLLHLIGVNVNDVLPDPDGIMLIGLTQNISA